MDYILLLYISVQTIVYIAAAYVLLAVTAFFIQEKFILKREKLASDFEYKYEVPFNEINFEVARVLPSTALHPLLIIDKKNHSTSK